MRTPLLIALALVLATGCHAAAPDAPFELEQRIVYQAVLHLSDGQWLEGGSGVVVDHAGAQYALTPAHAFARDAGYPLQDLEGVIDHISLETYGPVSVEGATASEVINGVGSLSSGRDHSQNLVLLNIEGSLSADVGSLQLGTDPFEGEWLFLVGCQQAGGPCVERLEAVQVSEIWQGGFAAVPSDPENLHAHAGAPVLSGNRRLVGIMIAVIPNEALEFVPASAVLARLSGDH